MIYLTQTFQIQSYKLWLNHKNFLCELMLNTEQWDTPKFVLNSSSVELCHLVLGLHSSKNTFQPSHEKGNRNKTIHWTLALWFDSSIYNE